jgi:hypothetical protein
MIALVVAGLYGIVHNQISYTVSPEYFTAFKFYQFHLLDSAIPERVRASMVGFYASWWMGFPIGILSGLAGFIHKTHQQMFARSLEAMGVAVVFTLLFGLCGLLYGYFQTSSTDMASYQYWYIPANLESPRRFLCAGYMHNSAYLGGVLSIPIAWTYQILVRIKNRSLK